MPQYRARIESDGQVHAFQIWFEAINIMAACELVKSWFLSPLGYPDESVVSIIETDESAPRK